MPKSTKNAKIDKECKECKKLPKNKGKKLPTICRGNQKYCPQFAKAMENIAQSSINLSRRSPNLKINKIGYRPTNSPS